ncbi:MAG: CPBP family intramembrane metalloprotease [Sphingomonadaceae bacterium]|nr:CPBP family intramembrane metalloprotease [Sphingomonadaceae bacterium]
MTAEADTRPLWRKIWEFPLVAMVVALVLLGLTLWATQWVLYWTLPGPFDPNVLDPNVEAVVRGLAGVGAVFAVYKLLIVRLGRVKRDDLPMAGALGDTALGLGAGLAIFSVVVGVAAVLGVYRVFGWGTLEGWLPFFMVGGVVAGFVEEVIFRGILFRWIEEFAGSWAALAISSLLFGLAHWANPNATLFSSVAIAIEAGILLGGAYMLTRSLWLAIGIHAGWNLTQGLVFDVSVSGVEVDGLVEAGMKGPDLLTGGAFGLEASAIALVVATAAGVWLVLQAKKEGNLIAPSWRR